VRIIAGTLGGRRIKAPPGTTARPTTDRVREALFSRVVSRLGSLEGLLVLDLFAGSGALGLEALSRGAAACVLVERNRRCAGVIRGNISALEVGDRARLLTMEASRAVDLLAGEGASAGLVLLDPPYKLDATDLLLRIVAAELLAPDGLLCLEHASGREPPAAPPGLQIASTKAYGDSVLTLYSRPSIMTSA